MLKVVLIEPEIAGNTGNVGRTCAATGSELHLVGPMGFTISERRLKRAGLDYWDKLAPQIYASTAEFLERLPKDADLFAFSAEGPRVHYDARFGADSWLVFGGESSGLPAELRALWRERMYRVPMAPGTRSLNLASAAAVVIYEASRPRRDQGPTRG